MVSGISILCFAASYSVALVLEISRMFFRLRFRILVLWGFAAAGLLAHTLYLALQVQTSLDDRGVPLSNWYHWLLVSAWVLALVYLMVAFSRPRSATGVFFLPLVLGLIALAQFFPEDQVFPASEASHVWGLVHGFALTLGTGTVLTGFAAGLMYLIQADRLKRKQSPGRSFRLPSLEWLQKVNERSLALSSLFLAAGLGAGIVLNLAKRLDSRAALPWTDPVVWTSGVLLAWIISAVIFSRLYRPARQGRKVAYLTVASFVFLAMVLAITFSGQSDHASNPPEKDNAAEVLANQRGGSNLSAQPGELP